MTHVARSRVRVVAPFELRLAAWGHGWVDLDPHGWCEDSQTFSSVLADTSGPVDVGVRAGSGSLNLRFESRRPLTTAARARLRKTVQRKLRLDEDLRPFWEKCRAVPRLRWVARRGAGRLLRSATVFEDLMKLLFTTNCSWAATRGMTARLVDALGEAAPSGRKCFPSAKRCAARDARFYRDVVRAGYRAESCVALSRAFATEDLTEATFTDPDLPTDELRERILALRGFGPYAAGQALRLLGRYDDLALDSWCRNKLATSDRAVERRYRPFGPYKGLALWMDLTADWHK